MKFRNKIIMGIALVGSLILCSNKKTESNLIKKLNHSAQTTQKIGKPLTKEDMFFLNKDSIFYFDEKEDYLKEKFSSDKDGGRIVGNTTLEYDFYGNGNYDVLAVQNGQEKNSNTIKIFYDKLGNRLLPEDQFILANTNLIRMGDKYFYTNSSIDTKMTLNEFEKWINSYLKLDK